jgi:hypothetical protein
MILVHMHPPLKVKVLANALDLHGDVGTLPAHPRQVLPAHTPNTNQLEVSVEEIDFGSCPAGSLKRVEAIGARTIDVRNTSSSTLEVLWVLPNSPFIIEPSHAVLGAGDVATFRCSFVPLQAQQCFDERLECYVDQSTTLRNPDIDDA